MNINKSNKSQYKTLYNKQKLFQSDRPFIQF